jgi:hypothetical protein
MSTRLDNYYAGKLELPLMVELGKNTVLQALQDQVESSIYPESLAFDQEGFVWDDGDIVLDVTFTDRKGFGRGRIVLQPCTGEDLTVGFLADVKFEGYLPSAGSS